MQKITERWEEVLADPNLANIPYKVETNEWGQVIVNPPPKPAHETYRALINEYLSKQTGGLVLSEPPIQTTKGVKVPDLAWAPRAFVKRHHDKPCYPKAPPLCVEVLSPSNARAEIEEKIALYLEAGAQEVWTCDKKGRITFYILKGEIRDSKFFPEAPGQYSL